jgi:hypothetical protein
MNTTECANCCIKPLQKELFDQALTLIKLQGQLAENKKAVEHLTKVIHGGIGLVMTIVITALIYLVVKKA